MSQLGVRTGALRAARNPSPKGFSAHPRPPIELRPPGQFYGAQEQIADGIIWQIEHDYSETPGAEGLGQR